MTDAFFRAVVLPEADVSSWIVELLEADVSFWIVVLLEADVSS